MRHLLLRSALLAGLVGTALAPGAAADQRDPSLPKLFQFLKTTTSPDEAGAIEDKIWSVWAETGDPALDKLMVQSSDAMDRNDFQAALKDLDTITAEKPNFAEGWNKRATVYYLMGDYEKALADIDRTLALEPRHFGALSGLGLTNMKLGRDEAAVDAFQRVLEIDPLYPNARLNLELAKNAMKRNSI
ncbi:MAG TPA: tetratricopeptide repeat protein [Dongiaceae bacterium]|nr:tetratricopeptide repeat protein [Dongiaceae bacterium]